MKEFKKTFNVPLYGGTFVVVFTSDKDPYNAAKKFFKHDNKELIGCKAATLISKNYDNEYPIILSSIATDGSIAHECLHAVSLIFNYSGITADINNDEPAAYLIGWLVDRVYECYDKFNKLKDDTTGKETDSVR